MQKWLFLKWLAQETGFVCGVFIYAQYNIGDMERGYQTLIAVVLIVLVLLGAYLLLATEAPPTESVYVRITDPSVLPSGTEAFGINFSSFEAMVRAANGSDMYYSGGSGTANILSLANASEGIGVLRVPYNSSIESLSLNVTSARIEINGTIYKVALNGNFSSDAFGGRVRSVAELLGVISPVLVPTFSMNETSFTLFPSMQADVIGIRGHAATYGNETLNANESSLISRYGAGIRLENGSVSTNGNDTSISVTVYDNSGSPVKINSLFLVGNEIGYLRVGSVPAEQQPVFDNISSAALVNESFYIISNVIGTLGSNSTVAVAKEGLSKLNSSEMSALQRIGASGIAASVGQSYEGNILNLSLPALGRLTSELNGSQGESLLRGAFANITGGSAGSLSNLNISTLESVVRKRIEDGNFSGLNITGLANLLVNANAEARMNFPGFVARFQPEIRYVAFEVLGNGGMQTYENGNYNASGGYVLYPGGKAVLQFNGKVILASGRVGINIIKGDAYDIVVEGSRGASANITVEAT